MKNKNYKKFLQIKEERKFDTLREINAFLTNGMGISDEDIGIVSVCSRPALMIERSKYGEGSTFYCINLIQTQAL